MRNHHSQLASLGSPWLGKLFTAASIRVERPHSVESWTGGTATPGESVAISPRTRFDLASITKIFTSSAVLRLVDAGVMSLEDPLHKYLPVYGASPVRQRVTLRTLLSHQSGLPRRMANMSYAGHNDQEIWDSFRKAKWKFIERTLLERLPGTLVYGDLGYMLLGRAVEVAAATTLDKAIDELVCQPLGLGDSGFGGNTQSPITSVKVSAGEVHDGKTRELGGVSGCAGIFSTAQDVSRLARAYLPGSDFLSNQMRGQAVSEQARDESKRIRRGLGWELRSGLPGEPEANLGQDAFGHSGFTGTLVWTDPKRLLTVTILTNGVLFDYKWKSELTDLYLDVIAAAIGHDESQNKLA